MAATVLLEHRLGDGSVHFDWMVERGASLITFRVMERIDGGEGRRFTAERLNDHRVAYLTYGGPISGGWGEVRRVAAGSVKIEAETEFEFRVRGELGAAKGFFGGRPGEDGAWHFEFAAEG